MADKYSTIFCVIFMGGYFLTFMGSKRWMAQKIACVVTLVMLQAGSVWLVARHDYESRYSNKCNNYCEAMGFPGQVMNWGCGCQLPSVEGTIVWAPLPPANFPVLFSPILSLHPVDYVFSMQTRLEKVSWTFRGDVEGFLEELKFFTDDWVTSAILLVLISLASFAMGFVYGKKDD